MPNLNVKQIAQHGLIGRVSPDEASRIAQELALMYVGAMSLLASADPDTDTDTCTLRRVSVRVVAECPKCGARRYPHLMGCPLVHSHMLPMTPRGCE